jgi:translation initiation factor 1A
MPNLVGGKKYKKTKHVSEVPVFVEAKEDQMYGRVIQVLGNRNTLTFCNDNIIRLCHIRGSIRKDMWISVGDIVLISIRDFLCDKRDKYQKGDILYKYDRDLYSKLKKEEGINIKLFLNIESAGIMELKRIMEAKIELENDIFSNEVDNNIENEDIFEEEDVDIDGV